MANARQEDKSTQGMEDAARRASERAAEQTSRVGQAVADQTSRAAQAAAETTEEVARASATLLKQNVETLQNAWRFGLEAATSVMGRLPSNLVARSVSQERGWKRQRNVRPAIRKHCFTPVPLLPKRWMKCLESTFRWCGIKSRRTWTA